MGACGAGINGGGVRVVTAVLLMCGASTARAEWPTLDEAVRLAQQRAPVVAAAEGELGVARAAGVQARLPSTGNPAFQVFVDRSIHSPSAYVQPELYVPVAVPGQRSARIEEANKRFMWRSSAREEAEGRALGDAVSAWAEGMVSMARVRLAEDAVELAREEAKIVEQRAELGDATTVDVSLAQAEIARYVQQRAEAEVRYSDARARLALLTGLEDTGAPTRIPRLPTVHRALDPGKLPEAVAEAPALESLAAQERYWTAARTRAEADKIPPLTIIMWGSRTEVGDVRAGAGVGWTIPLMDRNQGEVARVLAERRRVQLTADATRRVLMARARNALNTFQTLRGAIGELDARGIPSAQAVVRATEEAHRAGKVDRLRVILARRDLVAAQDRRLQLLEAVWRAYADLTAILGEMP